MNAALTSIEQKIIEDSILTIIQEYKRNELGDIELFIKSLPEDWKRWAFDKLMLMDNISGSTIYIYYYFDIHSAEKRKRGNSFKESRVPLPGRLSTIRVIREISNLGHSGSVALYDTISKLYSRDNTDFIFEDPIPLDLKPKFPISFAIQRLASVGVIARTNEVRMV